MNDARDVDQERMRGMMRWMSIGGWRRGRITSQDGGRRSGNDAGEQSGNSVDDVGTLIFIAKETIRYYVSSLKNVK